MFKWAFWLGILAAGVVLAFSVIPVYYNNMKVQNIFEGVAENLATQSESDVERRMNELFKIQTVDLKALPPEFFENLSITKEDGIMQIGTEYHITLWLLDEPQSVDPDKEYKESEVAPMDKLRLRARLDFDFAPYAESH